LGFSPVSFFQQPTFFSARHRSHSPTAIIMNYNALKSAVEDTMKWEPNTVELSLYESLEHTAPQRFNLKEWMVPEKKIPPAFKRMSPMMVSTYPHG
jgi:hypothetical protein